MPTGYTSDVVDGKITELKPFALQLARGMGALIMMRDDPWDAPIPDKFEPSEYSRKSLNEARARHVELLAMTNAECDLAAQAEYDADIESKTKWLEKKRTERKRYDAMIAKVEAWQNAPDGLKEFGLEQLTRGKDFDCREGPYWKEPELLTGEAWRVTQLEQARKSLERESAAYESEVARTNERNAWVAQLKASLET